MKSRLAIFDLDGTLFDTRRVNYYAYKYGLNQFGCDIDFETFGTKFNGSLYKTYLPGIMGSDEHIEEVHKIKIAKYPEYLSEAVKNESLFAMIDSMKDTFHIAIVSTAATDNLYEILDYFDVRDKFELILTQSDVTKHKPDPEGFIKAMKHFDIEPENTIVFEDSEIGIEAAKKAGCVTYVVKGYS